MGMTVFSGMLVATLVGVLLVPAMFIAVEQLFGSNKKTSGPDSGAGAKPLEPEITNRGDL